MSELKIWKAITEVRYPAAALLFDKRGEIASHWQSTSDLTEWRISPNLVTIHNRSNTTLLNAGLKSASVVMELPPSYSHFEQAATNFFGYTLTRLKVTKFERIGLRIIYLAERKNFKLLASHIRETLFKLEKEDWDIFGGYPKDVGFSLALELGENRGTFALGPVQRVEVVDSFESKEVQDRTPAVALMIDFDFYRMSPAFSSQDWRKDLERFYKQGGETMQSMTTKFLNRYGGFEG